jgi:DNA-binding transcriptional LysR family regulator
METHLRNWGVEPNIVFRTEDNGIMQALVAAGVGAALAPRLAVDERDTAVRILMLDGFPRRVLALAWHQDRYQSPAATAFVGHARRICAELEEHGFTAEPSERVATHASGRLSDPKA